MNRETLRAQGLSEEQIDAVMADHGRSMQQVQSRLTQAETHAADLQTRLDQATNSEEIQTLTERAETAENQVTELQGQLSQITVDNLVNSALSESGAKDIDYIRYKLGEVELSEDGKSIKDIENKIKDLQANLPDQFTLPDAKKGGGDEGSDPLDGFKRVDNKLQQGQQSEPNTEQAMIDAFMSDVPQQAQNTK